MFRDIINKGKEIADKVTNIVMNFTEVETKVREATSDEAWGPHGRLMMQIAEYTYCHSTYVEVMTTLWKRMHTENERNWRRVYKSLLLLDFLLKNGSEQVISGAREHIYDIRTLESFHYHDEYGKDQGINVRLKVQEVINMIQDPEKLREERAKAKATRHLYTGYGGSDRGGWYSSDDSHYGSRHSDNDYDEPVNGSRFSDTPRDRGDREFQVSSNSSSGVPVQQRLGDFDEWHIGRERGVVDEVLEQIKEAWDVAKLSTKDLFFKKDADVDIREANPRMVSEEMYEFPEAAVEVDGTLESDHAAGRSEPRYTSRSVGRSNREPGRKENAGSREVSPVRRRRAAQPESSNHVEVFELGNSQEPKPRPPSMDLMGSWGELQTAASAAPAPSADDLFDLSDGVSNGTGWPGSSTVAQQTPWLGPGAPVKSNPPASSMPNASHATNSTTVGGGNSLLDSDFGDFLSATSIPTNVAPSNPVQQFSVLNASKPATLTATGLGVPGPVHVAPAPAPLWPGSQNGLRSGTPIPPFYAGGASLITGTTAMSSAPCSQPATNSTQSQSISSSKVTERPSVQPVGSTWKELDALGINLDTLAKPDRLNQRQTAGPSLRELQQTQQKVSSPPATTPAQSPMFASPLTSPIHTTLTPKPAGYSTQPMPNPTRSNPVTVAAPQTTADFSLI